MRTFILFIWLFFYFPTLELKGQEEQMIEPETEMKTGTFGDYIQKNICYSWEISSYDIRGKVFAEFRLDSLGRVYNAKILKQIGYGTDTMAIKLINGSSGLWDVNCLSNFDLSKRLIFWLYINPPYQLNSSSEANIIHYNPDNYRFLHEALTRYFNKNPGIPGFEIEVWINEFLQLERVLIPQGVSNEVQEAITKEFKRVSGQIEFTDDTFKLFSWWPGSHITYYVVSKSNKSKPELKISEYENKMRKPYLLPYYF